LVKTSGFSITDFGMKKQSSLFARSSFFVVSYEGYPILEFLFKKDFLKREYLADKFIQRW